MQLSILVLIIIGVFGNDIIEDDSAGKEKKPDLAEHGTQMPYLFGSNSNRKNIKITKSVQMSEMSR